MTVSEAAQRLGVSPSTIYALCSRRLLAHSRVGTGRGTIRINEADLIEYQVAARVETAGQETDRKIDQKRDWRKAMEEERKKALELARAAR